MASGAGALSTRTGRVAAETGIFAPADPDASVGGSKLSIPVARVPKGGENFSGGVCCAADGAGRFGTPLAARKVLAKAVGMAFSIRKTDGKNCCH